MTDRSDGIRSAEISNKNVSLTDLAHQHLETFSITLSHSRIVYYGEVYRRIRNVHRSYSPDSVDRPRWTM